VCVYDVFFVAVLDGTHNLLVYSMGLILMQAVSLLDILQELLLTVVFHHSIDMIHCFHHLEQFNHIWVVQCLLLITFGWCRDC
jgi:hypothetical protein